jgi:hypothetical protein
MTKLKYALIAVGGIGLVIVFIVFALNPDRNAAVNKPFTRFENIKPPAAGVPSSPRDISGIYRDLATDLLQLRADAKYSLTDQHGADSGAFTLVDGHFVVHSTQCGAALGTYAVVVVGPQEAGKAALRFSAQDDPCVNRRATLTAKPWVYANS